MPAVDWMTILPTILRLRSSLLLKYLWKFYLFHISQESKEHIQKLRDSSAVFSQEAGGIRFDAYSYVRSRSLHVDTIATMWKRESGSSRLILASTHDEINEIYDWQ